MLYETLVALNNEPGVEELAERALYGAKGAPKRLGELRGRIPSDTSALVHAIGVFEEDSKRGRAYDIEREVRRPYVSVEAHM